MPQELTLEEANTDYRLDQQWYYRTYPDVQAAVETGIFASAHDHYIHFGRAEGRYPCAEAEEDHRMARGPYANAGCAPSEAERQAQVGAVWSVDVTQNPGWYWMAHPNVQARLNLLASGDATLDSYDRLTAVLRARDVPVPIERAVSIGCGFGGLERNLASRGIIHAIDAYDIAPGAIAEAQRLAKAGGFAGLRYHVADVETQSFAAGAVDVVFAHQSVHHVERLDALFESVSAMLKPGGLFHLHEFVGPNRFQWTDAQIAAVNCFLESLPPRLRALPSGQPRPLQGRASIAAMIAADPSEAIRSADIIPALRRHFDILEERPLGGALLHLGLAEIAQNFDPESPADCAVLADFFATEDAAMAAGVVGSDFTVITAVKRGNASSF